MMSDQKTEGLTAFRALGGFKQLMAFCFCRATYRCPDMFRDCLSLKTPNVGVSFADV